MNTIQITATEEDLQNTDPEGPPTESCIITVAARRILKEQYVRSSHGWLTISSTFQPPYDKEYDIDHVGNGLMGAYDAWNSTKRVNPRPFNLPITFTITKRAIK